ncbi:MAG: hypothetical protein GVY02_08610, partial [Bacteroidetes bacterium]|nr:hypothetical protein [Bacteroidota bacterium]
HTDGCRERTGESLEVVDISRSCRIFIFSGEHFNAVPKITVRHEAAVKQKEDTSPYQQHQHGCAPSVVSEGDNNLL